MDLKTLEYLEEKVRKARSLARKINNLRQYVEYIDMIDDVIFKQRNGTAIFRLNDDEDGVNAVAKIKVSLKAILEDEIKRLEREFAEL